MTVPYRRPQKAKNSKILSAATVMMLEPEINVAWAEKDLEKTIQLLNKVIKVAPRSSNTRLMIGRAHGMQYEYAEAIDSFEQAVELAPKDERLMVLLKAGSMARDFFDPTIAESFFEEAVDLSGTVAAKVCLAEHSLRIRKLDVAKALVDEVLQATPEDPFATFLWCRLHENRMEDCVGKLKQILSTHTGELNAKAGYQLAKMLDMAGDYDGAMRALATAKDVLMPARNQIVQQRQIARVRHMDLAKGFDLAKRMAWQDIAAHFGPPRKLALLAGHPRSGTTLLEQVLDSHPGIVSAEETENFNIFSLSPLIRDSPHTSEVLKVMDACTPAVLQSAREAYFEKMDQCLGESVDSRLLLDKNPSLTSLVPAMFRTFPETKFITMLRDPRDVVLSCYMQSFVPVSVVNGNYLTMEDTAAEYAGVMGVWNEVAERMEGSACEVRYENMVEDLEGNARKALNFLGLEWSDSVMDYDQHARNKVVRSPTADAVTEKVHSRAKNRWKNYEKYLEPVFQTLQPYLKAFGYD